MTRHRPPTRNTNVEALFATPQLWELASALDELPRTRRRRHPTALHLAYGALGRLYRSHNRLDAELAAPTEWAHIVDLFNTHRPATHPSLEPHAPRLTLHTYRHFRHWLADPEHLERYCDTFTATSLALARTIGLLDPAGPGSITRPHPTRTIYGDGTIVRPIYSQSPTGTRIDHDAAAHTRHDGTIVGNNLVHFAVRGPEPQRRVILAVGRAPLPGSEAATAVELVRRIHRHAPAGAIQAVVYDGAFRGTHHDTLMSELGVLVINRVHPASRDGDQRTWRPHLLGTWTHTHHNSTCAHTLVANAGAICESRLDDTGNHELSEPLRRRQVRRYPRRRTGGWRFSIGVDIACPLGDFTAWVSPHPPDPNNGGGRPDQIRLLPEHDPGFLPLYGLRNDSESINADYKRTLPFRRAPALGWRRQVIDLTNWSLLTNSLAWALHRPDTTSLAA